MDHLELPLPMFLSQLKGILTNHRYRAATVFVDHFIHISYVHLHINITPYDTLNAKQYFEAYSQKQGVIVRHYHADNGRFTNSTFIKSVNTQGKHSNCGVNSHFQNGIAEKGTRYLQEKSGKQILHAT